ncbi:MAG: hypothetical protein ABJC62_02055, partial [Frankiaceae bacterium]
GVAPAPSRTPRQQLAYYDREAFLEGGASLALSRVVQALESSRYAVSTPGTADLYADVRQVIRAAAGSRRAHTRSRLTDERAALAGGLLAERLSRNLSRLPGDPTLLVSSVSLQSGDGDAVRLVVWTPNNQRWQVTFPLDPGEAERLTDLDAFVLIYRANLE